MKKQSRTVPRRRQSESPSVRHLPLVEILIDTQAELQELVVASGLKVLEAMLEEDRAAVCGPRYAHQPERRRWCADAGRPTRFKPSSPSPTDAVRDGSATLGHPVQNVTREYGLTPLPR